MLSPLRESRRIPSPTGACAENPSSASQNSSRTSTGAAYGTSKCVCSAYSALLCSQPYTIKLGTRGGGGKNCRSNRNQPVQPKRMHRPTKGLFRELCVWLLLCMQMGELGGCIQGRKEGRKSSIHGTLNRTGREVGMRVGRCLAGGCRRGRYKSV